MNPYNEKENYGAEKWRAPELKDGDRLIFDEPGRLLDNYDGRAGQYCSRAYYFRVVAGEFGGLRLLVNHGGGQEDIPLGGKFMGIEPSLQQLNGEGRYRLLAAIYHVQEDQKQAARSETAAEYRRAFVEGRLKKRKVKQGVKVWIEPAKGPQDGAQ